MKAAAAIRALVISVSVILLAACASAKPVGEWRDESFSGKLNNILVIGVTSQTTRRRGWENRFVEELAARGVNGVPSYTLLESSLELTRDIVERAIEDQGLDGVLVTRLVGIREKETYRLPANYDDDRGYIGYYDHAWKETSGGYYAEHKIFTLETNLYDVASGKLVWTMQSESMDASQPRGLVEKQIRLKVETLKKHGLI